MSRAKGERIERRRVGEIPLLQAAARKLGFREVLARHIRRHGNERVAAVDAVMLLVFNIARSRQPLYELTDWVSGLDPRMFDFEVPATGLSDDCFGRALDKVYTIDRASAMTEIVLAMVAATKLSLDRLHNDSTSLKAFGRIPGRTKNGLSLLRLMKPMASSV